MPLGFPALSVRQPMADYITWGIKDVENRAKKTRLRGSILIHASKAPVDLSALPGLSKLLRKEGLIGKEASYEPTYGALIGVVDIVDCVTASSSPWFEGPYGWVLANARRFIEPIAYRGAVGIFYVPPVELVGTPLARLKPAVATA